MRLATNPKQLPTTTPTLPRRFASLSDVAIVSSPRLPSADDLEQLHHVRRAEEVMPDHAARPPAGARELVDVERRAVGGQDAVGRGHPAELGERALLQIHVLEHGFDDDVDLIEPVVGRRRRDEPHRAIEGLLRHPALRDRCS